MHQATRLSRPNSFAPSSAAGSGTATARPAAGRTPQRRMQQSVNFLQSVGGRAVMGEISMKRIGIESANFAVRVLCWQ